MYYRCYNRPNIPTCFIDVFMFTSSSLPPLRFDKIVLSQVVCMSYVLYSADRIHYTTAYKTISDCVDLRQTTKKSSLKKRPFIRIYRNLQCKVGGTRGGIVTGFPYKKSAQRRFYQQQITKFSTQAFGFTLCNARLE